MNRRTLATTLVTSVAMAILAGSFAANVLAAPPIVPLTAGTFHTCAITPTGGAMCWGAGGDGALGNGSTGDINSPDGVTGLGSGIAAIAAGWYHTCALTTGGGGRCWGDNSRGQLGDGTNNGTASPVEVTGYINFGIEEISGGGFHTCAIAGGRVTCWGANDFGQLGDGGTSDSNVPVANPTLTVQVSGISAGYNHTCAIASGDVWCWGDNASGQLGDGSNIERHAPVAVDPPLPANAMAVAAGEAHTCALIVGGQVLCWGDNSYGQLGDTTFDESNTPRYVEGLAGVAAISSHGNHTCALTTGGAVWCWGDNLRGQLGDGSSNNVRNEPAQVVGLTSGVAEIAAGYYHSCALTTAGVVKCWGWNNFGQLGDGTNTTSSLPVDVPGTFGSRPISVSIGDATVAEGDSGLSPVTLTVSLSEPSTSPVTVDYRTFDGDAQSGLDYSLTSGTLTFAPGETTKTITVLVIGDTFFEPDETFVVVLLSATGAAIADESGTVTIAADGDVLTQFPTRIAVSYAHSCAVTAAGGVKCWGSNRFGKLGDGTTTDRSTATAVSGLASGVVSVAAGGDRSCALTSAGAVLCWGANLFGQFGFDSEPVPVGGLAEGVAMITAGAAHTCALTIHGDVLCWGENGSGQVGDGTRTTRLSPVRVSGLTPVVGISASANHTCAVTAIGGVWCWGSNLGGALGDGTTTERLSPVAVSGLTGRFVAVGVGQSHSCAVPAIGVGLFCWGDNVFGQLGDGSPPATAVPPVRVSGNLGPIVWVAGGRNSTCAVNTGGAAFCWGDNNQGQVGDGTTTERRTATPVSGLSNGASGIAAGEGFACAVVSPAAKCWGQNFAGRLGDGTADVDHHTPAEVRGYRPDLSIGDATVAEGNAGTSAATFTIRLSEPVTTSVSVDYTTLDDTATAGDFAPALGTVVFAAGETVKTITVLVVGDTTPEPDETFILRICCSTVPITDDTGVGTITNDDSSVKVSIGDTSVLEGNIGTTPATLSITLSEPSTQTVTVDWKTQANTALSGDFTAEEGTATFLPGAVSQTVSVDVLGDSEAEGPEDFRVVLSSPTNAQLVKGTAVVTIIDDDGSSIAIGDTSVTEGNTGRNRAVFLVTLSAPQRSTITVEYSTVGSDAVAGSDFVATSGTVTFTPFEVEEQIAVDVNGDTTIEADEVFSVVLANPVGASIDDGVGQGTIVDDDVPTISITDTKVAEANTGSTQAALTVSLSAASPATITVRYATAESSATAGADFQAASGTLTFAPGQTTKEIRVDVLGDTLDENNETFNVTLSQATKATLADDTGVVTITDDDAPPTLSVNDVSLREGDTGSAPVAFTISLSSRSGKAIAVSFRTSSGSASAGGDYTTTSGTATIAAGATSVQVQVPVRGDTIDENNETFKVTLSSPSNATIADGTGVGTIIDDDPKPVISYFQPSIVAILDTVTIRGSGFTGATAVQFIPMGGGPIPSPFFQVVNDSKISAFVPPGATTGRVWVTTPNGLAISPVDLLLQPKITAIAPLAGPEGSIVTIYGSGFFGATSVRFGSTLSVPIVVSDTIMMTIVPQGAKSSRIQVITPAGVATSADVFTVFVLPPPPP